MPANGLVYGQKLTKLRFTVRDSWSVWVSVWGGVADALIISHNHNYCSTNIRLTHTHTHTTQTKYMRQLVVQQLVITLT